MRLYLFIVVCVLSLEMINNPYDADFFLQTLKIY